MHRAAECCTCRHGWLIISPSSRSHNRAGIACLPSPVWASYLGLVRLQPAERVLGVNEREAGGRPSHYRPRKRSGTRRIGRCGRLSGHAASCYPRRTPRLGLVFDAFCGFRDLQLQLSLPDRQSRTMSECGGPAAGRAPPCRIQLRSRSWPATQGSSPFTSSAGNVALRMQDLRLVVPQVWDWLRYAGTSDAWSGSLYDNDRPVKHVESLAIRRQMLRTSLRAVSAQSAE